MSVTTTTKKEPEIFKTLSGDFFCIYMLQTDFYCELLRDKIFSFFFRLTASKHIIYVIILVVEQMIACPVPTERFSV